MTFTNDNDCDKIPSTSMLEAELRDIIRKFLLLAWVWTPTRRAVVSRAAHEAT